VVLWLYIAVAAFTDGKLLTDTWAWLGGLDTIPAIVAWVAILPIAAWVWAWQAGLEPLLMGLVLLGMAAWTMAAFGGSLRTLRRARRRR